MKTDYADFLSPMLVKELRQGVRNRAFLSTFVLLQVTMLLMMITGLLSVGEFGSEGGTYFFWVLVGVSVLVILPMSGMNAIGGEIRANTLDLIFLTRLTSLWIVVGKWLAIVTSSVLLVSAVLPYLVLRYFIGGVNLSTELIALFSILGGSALLTGITVGMSAFQTRLGRGLLVAFLFVALRGVGPFLFYGLGGIPLSSMPNTTAQTLCLVAGGVLLLLLMLDLGASKIAPAAENHSAIQRTLALALLGLATVAGFLRGNAELLTVTSFLLACLVCAAALCEQPRAIPSLYRPLAARGFAGRILGRFLYPGWHTGIWFATVVFLGYAMLMAHEKLLDSTAAQIRLVAAFGTLLLPVAVTRVFFPKTDRPVVVFFVVTVTCLVTSVLCFLIDGAVKTKLGNLVSFLPIAALMRSVDPSDLTSVVPRFVMPVVTGLSWLALAIQSLRAMPKVSLLEKQSLPPVQTPPATDALTLV